MSRLTNINPSSALTQEYLPGNLMDRLGSVEDLFRQKDLEDSPTTEETANDQPTVFSLILSPAEGIKVTDPTDTAYTGFFIAGNGIDFDSVSYVAGNVLNGEILTGMTAEGTLFAQDAVIEGTVIIGPGSEAGGWLIDATRIYNNQISLDSAIPAILIGAATAPMVGAGVFIGNDAGTYKMRIGNPAGNYLLWDGTTLQTQGQWIKSAGMNPALQEWQTNIVFSSVSDTQINWTSGTIILSDGTTYTISSGNTGAMAALTYIYLNIAVSLTVLQITTTYSTATGDGKILVAAAQNHSAGASIIIFSGQQPIINGGAQITALSILAGNIAAGSITASKISVTSLSAITATMGSLTIDSTLTLSGASGAITIGTTPPSSATVGTGLWIDRTGVYSLLTNVQQATLTSAGLSAGAGAVKINASGIIIASTEFSTATTPVKWISDDTSVELGTVLAFYNALASPLQSGTFLTGKAKTSSYVGFSGLTAMGDSQTIGQMLAQFRIDTRGIAGLDLRAGTNTANNSKGFTISNEYSATNVVQSATYYDTYTSGTAGAGIGTSLTLRAEDGSGNMDTIGVLFAQSKVVTNGSEYSLAGFYNVVLGTAVAKFFAGIVYANHLNTSVSTSGQTTVFSVAVPASFFGANGGGQINWAVYSYIDSNANARNFTTRFTVGAKVITEVLAVAANQLRTAIFTGSVSRRASNQQDMWLLQTTTLNSAAGSVVADYDVAAETETAAITVSLTFQLSGSVDAGFFNAVTVYALDSGNTW